MMTAPRISPHFAKMQAKSLAHYLVACAPPRAHPRDARRNRRPRARPVGPRPGQTVVRFPGDRRSKDFAPFCAKHPGAEIITASEWADAEPVAAAVLADEIASELIRGGKREAALRWQDGGFPCATDGIDLLGPDYVCDLKTSVSSEPERLQRLALASGARTRHSSRSTSRARDRTDTR